MEVTETMLAGRAALPNGLGWTTPATTGAPSSPVSPRTHLLDEIRQTPTPAPLAQARARRYLAEQKESPR